MKDIKPTRSICPECLKAIDATIYEDQGKVFIKKDCPEHGHFQELYWSDYDQYMRAEKFRYDGDGMENPRTEKRHGCPYDCGICPEHKSHTALAIIDVTNRCNLKCPVCFANASAAGYVYEPTAEQIRGMLENLHNNKPVPATALQFSGGEPTIRKELFDFIRKAKEIGFKHVEVNTNGVRIAKDPEYAKKLKEAGVSTIYLQFDGLTPDVYKFIRGLDLLEIKMKALENLREAGYDSVVLVVTLVKGVNDGQLGDIIKFRSQKLRPHPMHKRATRFSSAAGCLSKNEKKCASPSPTSCVSLRNKPTATSKLSDFYPVPVVVPVSKAVGAIKDKRYVEFTAHPHCGMATFVFIENGKMTPITRYGNIEKFVGTLQREFTLMQQKGNKKQSKTPSRRLRTPH